MRKSSVIFGTCVMVVTIAAVSTAAPPPSNPGNKPPMPQIPKDATRAPYFVGVKPVSRAYATGPVAIEVEIKNTSSNAIDSNLLLDRMQYANPTPQAVGRVGTAPVKIPAGGSATVTISDSRGLPVCDDTFDRLTVEGVPSLTSFVKLDPSCIFTAKKIDPNDGTTSPDRIASQQQGKAFYDDAIIKSRQPKCGGFVSFQATLNNRTSRPIRANLKVISPEGEPSYSPSTAPLDPNGERKDQLAGARFRGATGRWRLEFESQTPGTPVWQPGIQAEVSRLCSLTAELTTTVAPPPSQQPWSAPGPE